MIPETTTLAPAVSPAQSKTILRHDPITGSLVRLESEDAVLHGGARQVADHVLYVAVGQVTVRIGDISTVLGQDQAMFVPSREAAPSCSVSRSRRGSRSPRRSSRSMRDAAPGKIRPVLFGQAFFVRFRVPAVKCRTAGRERTPLPAGPASG